MTINSAEHKSGFVNIIGMPNAGKSSLLNSILGNKMVIVSHKPQTTRHRIFGIMNEDDFQIVFSDTPGIIRDESYKMQAAMNYAAFSIFEDADVVLVVIDLTTTDHPFDIIEKHLAKAQVPLMLVLNKADLVDKDRITELRDQMTPLADWHSIHITSAETQMGVDQLKADVIGSLPIGPPYYPKDQLSDRPIRFFVAELIREQIFLQYHQEIPYSTEVAVTEYQEQEKRGKPFARIYAIIFCMRQSQKGILLGKKGTAIKALGIAARKSIEEAVGHQVHLELHIKIKENWRNNDLLLKSFGYLQS